MSDHKPEASTADAQLIEEIRHNTSEEPLTLQTEDGETHEGNVTHSTLEFNEDARIVIKYEDERVLRGTPTSITLQQADADILDATLTNLNVTITDARVNDIFIDGSAVLHVIAPGSENPKKVVTTDGERGNGEVTAYTFYEAEGGDA